jgi:hypothetical protein
MMTTNILIWQQALLAVEKLSWPDQLRLISELLQRIQTKAIETEPIDILTLAGVGAEIWVDVDTDSYINRERDSWEN